MGAPLYFNLIFILYCAKINQWMSETKKVLVTGFALFSLFFGAGNLILPPFLGLTAKSDWIWIAIGFALTAVIIPIMGIMAHAKIQGTLFDLGKKVSPLFSYTYCIIICEVVAWS